MSQNFKVYKCFSITYFPKEETKLNKDQMFVNVSDAQLLWAQYTATKENTDVLASCLEPFDTYKEE